MANIPFSVMVTLVIVSPIYATIPFSGVTVTRFQQCPSLPCPVNFSFRHLLYLPSAEGSPSFKNPVKFVSTYRWSPVFLEMEQRRFTYYHFRLSHDSFVVIYFSGGRLLTSCASPFLPTFASLEGYFGPSASTHALIILPGGIDILPSSYLWMISMTLSAEITGLCGRAEVASITVDVDIT